MNNSLDENNKKTIDLLPNPRVYNFMASKESSFKIPKFSDYHNFKDWTVKTPQSEDLLSMASDSSEHIPFIGDTLKDKFESIGLVSTIDLTNNVGKTNGSRQLQPNFFRPIKDNPSKQIVAVNNMKQYPQLTSKPDIWKSGDQAMVSEEREVIPKIAFPDYSMPPSGNKMIAAHCVLDDYSVNHSLFKGDNRFVGSGGCTQSEQQLSSGRDLRSTSKFNSSVKRMKLEDDVAELDLDLTESYPVSGIYESSGNANILSVFDKTRDIDTVITSKSHESKRNNRTKTIQFQV